MSVIKNKKAAYVKGFRDGIPIGLGYFAVSFSLGIVAKMAGLTAFEGFLTSLLINASAGEKAGFVVIAENGSYIAMALAILVANARYFLMSSALSQKISPDTPFFHRLIIGFDVTDEVFGISIAQEGFLNPFYTYGAMTSSIPCWAVGTALGVIAGEVLPLRVVSALSVALYGMFLAVIIPPSKKDKKVLGLVVISFLLSALMAYLPVLREIPEGTRTIILTVVIAAAAAFLLPLKEEVGACEE